MPRLGWAQEGNCKKQSLRKLPLLVSFCFYDSGNAPGREQVQIWLWVFSSRQAELKDWLWSWFGGIQLIPQGEFIQVHHHFTFNLLYNTISAYFQSQSSTTLSLLCGWMLVGTKHVLFVPLALLGGGETTVLMQQKCVLVSLSPCQNCSRGGITSHRAWGTPMWAQQDSCGH